MTIGSVRPPRRSEVFIEAVETSEATSSEGTSETPASELPRGLDRRKRIILACATCGGRNYRKTKARREGVAPIQLMKFCSTCNAHTLHREAV